ncbi:MAG: hypothetical protein HY340_04085 [Candidatus Kerfeldbacteria bacterium]|nr:hypothetical protein [Candidatus Kerfeldbacteria bacterium]
MMRLSALQRYILVQSIQNRKSVVARNMFRTFYQDQKDAPKDEDQQNAMTKSLERLIDKGLLIGYGRRTPEKWFIDSIKLTPSGRRTARTLLGEQQRLPLRLGSKKGTRP